MKIKFLFILSVTVTILFGACKSGASNSAALEHGKQVYLTYCLGCHMDDGAGVPSMNAPLISSQYVNGDKNKLISIVLQGSAAFAGDPSRTYRNMMGAMPNLSDAEVADVLTYVRNNFKNKAPDVTPEEVKAVRDKLK